MGSADLAPREPPDFSRAAERVWSDEVQRLRSGAVLCRALAYGSSEGLASQLHCIAGQFEQEAEAAQSKAMNHVAGGRY